MYLNCNDVALGANQGLKKQKSSFFFSFLSRFQSLQIDKTKSLRPIEVPGEHTTAWGHVSDRWPVHRAASRAARTTETKLVHLL